VPGLAELVRLLAVAMICLGLLICPTNADAQESPVGRWKLQIDDEEGDFDVRLLLAESGAADLRFSGQASDEAFPEPLDISFGRSGTWTVEDGELVIDLTQKDLRINGKPFVEAIDDLGETVALSLAEDMDIPHEDLPALVETVQAALQEELDEEELLAEFVGLLEGGIVFTVVAGELRLDDGEGGVEIWKRMQQTAVGAQSWATIKANSWTK
jgi:hypothetical protein